MQDDEHFQRLTQAVRWSDKNLEEYRRINRLLVDASMGEHYPRFDGVAPDTPINLLWMAHRAMSRFLYMRTPKALATTQVPQWHSFAEDAEIALNRTLKESAFGETLSEVVDQSLYSVGALYMDADYVGTPTDMRQELVIENVPFPDLVWNSGTGNIDKSDYIGRRVEMCLVDIHQHPLFDEEARMQVSAQNHQSGPNYGDTTWQRAYGSYKTDLYDYAQLYQVFDRKSGRMYVWPVYQPELKLRDSLWNGPRNGPIRLLHYGRPPGHPFPVSPMGNVYRLARAHGVLLAKSLQQQQAAKGLLLYTSASKEEAQDIVDSVDLNSVLQEHGAVRWTQIGGAAPDTVAMAEQSRKLFSYAVGNLDQLMGLGSQSPTLGQERMLSDSATANMKDMGEVVYKFIQGAVEDAYWFNIRDPETRDRVWKKLGKTGLSFDVSWTPEKRRFIEGMKFEVEVEPYSYKARTPDGRLADLLGALQILQQFGPQMMAQGIMVDVESVVRTIAKYKDLPELYDSLILNQDPERLAQLLGPREGRTPMDAQNQGPKRYIRESTSDGAGAEQEMMRMFGRGQQDQVVSAA